MKTLFSALLFSLLVTPALACEDHADASAELKQVLSDETEMTQSSAEQAPAQKTGADAETGEEYETLPTLPLPGVE